MTTLFEREATRQPDPDISEIASKYDRVAPVLQGGGALGPYQAAVYQALAEANCDPKWIAGGSIGADNSAPIAGNPQEHRLAGSKASGQRSRNGKPGLLRQRATSSANFATRPAPSWRWRLASPAFSNRALSFLGYVAPRRGHNELLRHLGTARQA